MGTRFVTTKNIALHITHTSIDMTYQQPSDRNYNREREHRILHSRLERVLIPRQGHGCFLFTAI